MLETNINLKMKNCTIRLAIPGDESLILNLIKELAEYEKLLDTVETTPEMLHLALFEEKTAEVLLVENNGIAIAFALFFHNFSTFVGRKGLYLEDLYVKPEWRGQGIGGTLLSELAKIAIDRNCGRMEWTVLDWNTPAIDVYKKIGAQLMEEWIICRVSSDKIGAIIKG